MKSAKVKQLEKKYVVQTYSRAKFVLEKGKGCYVYDKDKKKYLDLVGGIACTPIGHGNKYLASKVAKQAKKLLNVSNLYYTEPQVELAEKLAKLSGLDKCFFCNSGAEANEAAIKLARKYKKKIEIIVMNHGFHGRTFGSLAATWKPKIKEPFKPLVPGFKFVKYNDVKAIEKAISKKTAAVMLEPIQGEAGIIVPDKNYLKDVSKLCKKKNVLLILDEVQTGNGRTGEYFCFKHSKIKPDIVTTAKGVANGIPLGVMIASNKVAAGFGKGDHASTFGGNNLASTAANATIDFILKKKLMKKAVKVGIYFINELNQLKNNKKSIKDVRGKGLMIAVELDKEVKPIVEKCYKEGFIINACGPNTLRFVPSLTLKKKHVKQVIKVLEEVL
ncbi:aspartate aminotransferase family protein [Candidatus Woesearchaeota archaeon]|nr:aspartate aminotransferase family protein [Candidatus Woesearchaeota archaeon]